MSKYKECPSCGCHNDPRSMECEKCGTDLMGIPILDSEQIVNTQTMNEDLKSDDQEPVKMVRICPCGEINPAQARKCQRCHEDISDILPTLQEDETSPVFQLMAEGDKFIFQIPNGSIIIGREHGMREWLAGKHYVSRIHAKLSVENGKLYVENLSRTNYTFVNNIRIGSGKTQLNPGDELSLGGITVNGNRHSDAAYFIVNVVEQ